MRLRKAFTLIELMVVVAVIGVLIGILMPALGSARAQARRTACSSNLRQIGAGLQVYMSGNRDRFPYASFYEAFFLSRHFEGSNRFVPFFYPSVSALADSPCGLFRDRDDCPIYETSRP